MRRLFRLSLCVADLSRTLERLRVHARTPRLFHRFGCRQVILGGVRPHGNYKEKTMAAVCQVTGATPGFGHSISHSHRRTKRRFDPNIQKKTYYVPTLGRKVTLTLSVKGIKTIDVRGIDAVMRDLIARGVKF
jgi:large subunit ribosomal protein L28